ncbi:MAG: tetratricopeptide repeat protein [Bdellovibrionales bacterium]
MEARMFMYKLFAISVLLLAMACSSAGIKISSEPEGADVVNSTNEVIGQTPLSVNSDQLTKIQDGSKLVFQLRKSGYQNKSVLLDKVGADEHKFKLDQLSAENFKSNNLFLYSKPSNKMVREALQIQGLLISKKVDEAAQRINEFQKQYPNIAASYVLLANISAIRNQNAQALQYLMRAQTIDPEDEVVSRMINQIRSTAGEKL